MSDLIIITGSTDTSHRFVQFWVENVRVRGVAVGALNVAEFNTGEAAFPLLRIWGECDPETIDAVLAAFAVFRAGNEVPPTHTVNWTFGKPEFTPIDNELEFAA